MDLYRLYRIVLDDAARAPTGREFYASGSEIRIDVTRELHWLKDNTWSWPWYFADGVGRKRRHAKLLFGKHWVKKKKKKQGHENWATTILTWLRRTTVLFFWTDGFYCNFIWLLQRNTGIMGVVIFLVWVKQTVFDIQEWDLYFATF